MPKRQKPEKLLLQLPEYASRDDSSFVSFSLRHDSVDELPEDIFVDIPDEFLADFKNLCSALIWLTNLSSEKFLGAYWSNQGRQSVEVFQYWLYECPFIVPYFPVLTPSDCSPGELLFQMTEVLKKVLLTPKQYSHLRLFIYSENDDEVSYDNTDWSSIIYNDYELYYGSAWRKNFIDDYSKRTKDIGSRRQLLTSFYEERPDRLADIMWVIQDAENLTLSAIKEIIYLSKALTCPFLLLGNEDLEKTVKSAKSGWIEICPLSGKDLDAEFIAQVQESDVSLSEEIFEFEESFEDSAEEEYDEDDEEYDDEE